MITLVIADGEMIHIMGQTYNEVVARRNGRYLFKWYLMLNKDVTHNCNVNLDHRDVCEPGGLAFEE